MIKQLFFLGVLAFFCSCKKTSPTFFLKEFQKENQVENNCVQNSNGGYTYIHWKSQNDHTFNLSAIIELAEKNKWTFIDSIKINEVKQWKFNNTPIFPLSYEGFNTGNSYNNSVYKKFPRPVNKDFTILKFKTTWILINQETNETINENGFIVLNSNRSQMSAYHLWGE